MYITFNGREIELSFGLRTLTEIDRELGFSVNGASLGQGLEMLIPNLQSGNPIGVSKLIKAASAHDKKPPQTYEELETVLDDVAEKQGFQAFGEQVIDELGKRPMTREILPKELRKESPVKEVPKKA